MTNPSGAAPRPFLSAPDGFVIHLKLKLKRGEPGERRKIRHCSSVIIRRVFSFVIMHV
jgi:hypothetical protein